MVSDATGRVDEADAAVGAVGDRDAVPVRDGVGRRGELGIGGLVAVAREALPPAARDRRDAAVAVEQDLLGAGVADQQPAVAGRLDRDRLAPPPRPARAGWTETGSRSPSAGLATVRMWPSPSTTRSLWLNVSAIAYPPPGRARTPCGRLRHRSK